MPTKNKPEDPFEYTYALVKVNHYVGVVQFDDHARVFPPDWKSIIEGDLVSRGYRIYKSKKVGLDTYSYWRKENSKSEQEVTDIFGYLEPIEQDIQQLQEEIFSSISEITDLLKDKK